MMGLITGNQLSNLIQLGLISGAVVKDLHSIDLHLSDDFQVEEPTNKVLHIDSARTHMMPVQSNSIRVRPQEFILAKTVEIFDLPSDVTGYISLRSRAARKGLNQLTSFTIKPGFKGQVVLELVNSNRGTDLVLNAGDSIAQVSFHKHDKVVPYGGRYQGQQTILP